VREFGGWKNPAERCSTEERDKSKTAEQSWNEAGRAQVRQGEVIYVAHLFEV
jgi:hypothetical protein